MRPLLRLRLHFSVGVFSLAAGLVWIAAFPLRRIGLVVGKGVVARAGLQNEHPHPLLGQHPRRRSASCAGADDHRVIAILLLPFSFKHASPSSVFSCTPYNLSAGAAHQWASRPSSMDARNTIRTNPKAPARKTYEESILSGLPPPT